MKNTHSAWTIRFAAVFIAFLISALLSGLQRWNIDSQLAPPWTFGEIMKRFIALPSLIAATAFVMSCMVIPQTPTSKKTHIVQTVVESERFKVQVVGLQWLNPLHRRDYPTEWELLWTLGLVKPNANDDMVRTDPMSFSKLQPVSSIAAGNDGKSSLDTYYDGYMWQLFTAFRSRYYTDASYFYTVAPDDRNKWRELAGIRIELALPAQRLLDSGRAGKFLGLRAQGTFDIGRKDSPETSSKDTPPDIRVSEGGTNAGFTSLSAALDYLKTHPNESVWAINWDAPSYPAKSKQLNENVAMLILAGPDMKTERAPLAWLGYPASNPTADFEAQPGSTRLTQAWKATFDAALHNAGKTAKDIGYTIHDAGHGSPAASDRIGPLAQLLTTELTEFDFMKQTFNTAALLGDMGAGGALTNVALAIAYANHLGKNVLVAGTGDAERPTAVIVMPPAKVRPIDPEKPWARARGGGSAYLPWWGLRHDAPEYDQGFSK